MQNKGSQHPFGSTVVGDTSAIPTNHPLGNGRGVPPGMAGAIPGAIGVAGAPRIAMAGQPAAEPDSLAQLIGNFLDKLGDKLADRIADRVIARLDEPLAPRQAADMWDSVVEQIAVPFRRKRLNTSEIAELDRALGANIDVDSSSSPPPTIAKAQYVTVGDKILPAVPVDAAHTPEALAEFSAAHTELASRLVEIDGVSVVRGAPGPLGLYVRAGYQIPTGDASAREWTIYHASYASPRMPVEATAGRFEVKRDGVRLAAPDTILGAPELGGQWGLTADQVIEAVRADAEGRFDEYNNLG